MFRSKLAGHPRPACYAYLQLAINKATDCHERAEAMDKIHARLVIRTTKAVHAIKRSLIPTVASEHNRLVMEKTSKLLNRLTDLKGKDATELKVWATALEDHALRLTMHADILRKDHTAKTDAHARRVQISEMAPDLV